MQCLNPPLEAIPDGEWFCPDCEDDLGGSVVVGAGRKPQKRAKKADADVGQKRKASGKDATGEFCPSLWPIFASWLLEPYEYEEADAWPLANKRRK